MAGLRHRWTWDFTGIPSKEHRTILQVALDNCDYPFKRIRRNTGRRVPVTISDLSRHNKALEESNGLHAHVHNGDEEAHILGDPVRHAALGLYWLPTTQYPAGRVELEQNVMINPDLAREVFLAEGAHAVDYGVPLTDAQRQAIFTAYHGGNATAHGDHGWFEEKGGQDYWAWVGESFMSGFMAAFAPSLPRPLEARQPWAHPTTPAIAAQIREILK